MAEYRQRLTFANLDRQEETLRAVYQAVTGASIAKSARKAHYPSYLYDGVRGDSLSVRMQSGNYGLGFTITRFTLRLGGAVLATEDRDFDNCPPEGGEFDIDAQSPEMLERIAAALVAWHAGNGVTSFSRSAR